MNDLKELITKNKKTGKKGFITCLTAGYPDINTTLDLAKIMAENGADIIELCVPFSDPVADGPTIQYSSHEALLKGISFNKILVLSDNIKKTTGLPIVFMSYLNPLYNIGLERYFKLLKNRADGLIIPDTVPEETSKFSYMTKINEVSLIPLVSPNTSKERMKYIDSRTDSFSYIVSLAGVTGERKDLAGNIKEYLIKTGKNMIHPRYLGFGHF